MVRNSQMWGGLFWLAIGAYVTWAGRDMGLGVLHEPGSGFAVFWIGVIMCGLALSVVTGAVMQGSEDIAALWHGTRWGKVLLVTLMLLAFGFFFEQIGFVVCSLLLLLVLMRFVDPVPWWQALVISFGATFGVWYVLSKVLKIQMPAGILAAWLG